MFMRVMFKQRMNQPAMRHRVRLKTKGIHTMTDTLQITLPITGMTCANCVATIERNLKKLDGVQSAVVNLSSERGTVDYDSAKLSIADLIARVNRAGYGVATGKAELIIKHLSDDNDTTRLEKALTKLEGV